MNDEVDSIRLVCPRAWYRVFLKLFSLISCLPSVIITFTIHLDSYLQNNILGSHTIGQGSCRFFRNRIYNDDNIDPTFATSLQANCPTTGGDDNLAPLDTTTPDTFDNSYFKNLQSQKGLFSSDQALFNGGSTDSDVDEYSSDSSSFATDFANAMVKMGNLNPITGSNGQIRTNCRVINWVFGTYGWF